MVTQLLFALHHKLYMHQKLICEHAYLFSSERIRIKNFLNQDQLKIPHLYENLILFFPNYRLHFSSNAAALPKLVIRPIVQSVNSAVGQLT